MKRLPRPLAFMLIFVLCMTVAGAGVAFYTSATRQPQPVQVVERNGPDALPVTSTDVPDVVAPPTVPDDPADEPAAADLPSMGRVARLSGGAGESVRPSAQQEARLKAVTEDFRRRAEAELRANRAARRQIGLERRQAADGGDTDYGDVRRMRDRLAELEVERQDTVRRLDREYRRAVGEVLTDQQMQVVDGRSDTTASNRGDAAPTLAEPSRTGGSRAVAPHQ